MKTFIATKRVGLKLGDNWPILGALSTRSSSYRSNVTSLYKIW